VEECVSLVDLTATILAAGGAANSLPMDGRDLLPVASGGPADGDGEAVCELYGTWTDRPIAMLRRGRGIPTAHNKTRIRYPKERFGE
jgi:hypothetical protein